MEKIALQHIQLFRLLTRGFTKGSATVQLLDIASGEVRHKEQPQIESATQYHHWIMEEYLAHQQKTPIEPLLESCRREAARGAAFIALSRTELEELELYLQYLLQRREAICKAILCRSAQSASPVLEVSTGELHAQDVAQSGCLEGYLPLLYHTTCSQGLVLPYVCVYTTRALFDSSSYAVPLSPECLLLYVYAPTHKYYYKNGMLQLQELADEASLQRLNGDALLAELQFGGRCLIGGMKDLNRLQDMLPGRHTPGQGRCLQLGS